jgi:hypothetical protein
MVTRVVASDIDYCRRVKLDFKADIEPWIQEIIKPGAGCRAPPARAEGRPEPAVTS